MTKEEAKIIVLEDALEEAQSTVEFLHQCLTNELFDYAYPEQALDSLEEWKKLVPPSPKCLHSKHTLYCPGCLDRVQKAIKLDEARKVLNG